MKKFKILTFILLMLFVFTGCKEKEPMQEETKKEEPKKVESNVTLENFQFKLLNAKIENGSSEFEFEITNISNEAKELKKLNITVKDENNDDLVHLISVINKQVESQDKITVTCSYGGDLSNYHSFDYKLVNE